MKLKQKRKKLAGILIVSMACLCFAGCKGNNEKQDSVDLGNQNVEESNDEQASAENMMAEETNAEDESEIEVAEEETEVSFDGYDVVLFYRTDKGEKDIIACNVPSGFEVCPIKINGAEEKSRFDINITGATLRDEGDENENRKDINIDGDFEYYYFFEYDGVDEERKEYYDSYRKILETTETGELETPFGIAKIYKIKRGFPRDSIEPWEEEYYRELGCLYEEDGIVYVTGEYPVAVFDIDGQHVVVTYDNIEGDFEGLLHQMFDL